LEMVRYETGSESTVASESSWVGLNAEPGRCGEQGIFVSPSLLRRALRLQG